MRRALLISLMGGSLLGPGCQQMKSDAGLLSPAYPVLAAEPMQEFRRPMAGGVGAKFRAGGESLAPAESPHLAVVEPRKVIYTGNFEILSSDVERSLERTKALCEQMGGYMQRMTSRTIVIRVPGDKFEEAVAALGKMGTMTRKDISAQDVTERYTDLEIRLKNAKVLLEKLRALLDRAQTVKDALAVEREIARVTTEVERLEGQLNRLTHQISLATLTVTFIPIEQGPDELKIKLPFAWLRELGLERLLNFGR